MQSILSKIIGVLLAFMIFFASPVAAEIKDLSTTGVYIAGASESLNDAKQHAREDALRQAVNETSKKIQVLLAMTTRCSQRNTISFSIAT